MSANNQTIEHVVLLNVKDNTDSTKITSMINSIDALNSLEQVVYLTTGPILNIHSSSFKFTHFVHARYKTKQDLNAYYIHPNHVNAVNEFILPICDDIMVVDWVSNIEEPPVPQPGFAMRVKLLKVKEGLGDFEKKLVFDVVGTTLTNAEQVSFGENYSPEYAKGFSIGSIAVFGGLSDLDGAMGLKNVEEEMVIKDLFESEIVLDYVIPTPATIG